MALYSDLRNLTNGNLSDIDRAGLITIARHFEGGKTASDIVYDREVDEEYTGVDSDV